MAQKLKWPSSYITDIIKGRRGLTIPRAMQFANYFKLGAVDFEKLLYLAIESSADLQPHDLRRIRCARAGEPTWNETSEVMVTSDLESKIRSLDGKTHFLFETICWLKEYATIENLVKLTAGLGLTSVEIEAHVQNLVEKKLLACEGEKLVPLVEGTFTKLVKRPNSEDHKNN